MCHDSHSLLIGQRSFGGWLHSAFPLCMNQSVKNFMPVSHSTYCTVRMGINPPISLVIQLTNPSSISQSTCNPSSVSNLAVSQLANQSILHKSVGRRQLKECRRLQFSTSWHYTELYYIYVLCTYSCFEKGCPT